MVESSTVAGSLTLAACELPQNSWAATLGKPSDGRKTTSVRGLALLPQPAQNHRPWGGMELFRRAFSSARWSPARSRPSRSAIPSITRPRIHSARPSVGFRRGASRLTQDSTLTAPPSRTSLRRAFRGTIALSSTSGAHASALTTTRSRPPGSGPTRGARPRGVCPSGTGVRVRRIRRRLLWL